MKTSELKAIIKECIREEMNEAIGNLAKNKWPDWDRFASDMLDIQAFQKYKVSNSDTLFKGIPIDVFTKYFGDPKTIEKRIKRKTARDKGVKIKVAGGKVSFIYPIEGDDGGRTYGDWDED